MKLANAESTLLGLKNKKILIVGKGIEGNAVYEYLIKHLPENKIDIVDQKDGVDYLSEQKEYDIAVKSPGVVPELITIPYTTATNIFMSNAKGKVIGITGTKGKSTTTTLIYEMMKAQDLDAYLGGNIGQSPLDFIDNLNDNSWTVLEMSSYQLNDLKVSPYIAVVLMITNEHLNYHKTQEAYIDAKRNILRFQNTQDTAIINKDYPVIALNNKEYTFVDRIIKMSDQNSYDNNRVIWRDNPMYTSQEKFEQTLINKVEKKFTQGYSVSFKLNNQCNNCVLILKQTFHPNWKITVNGKKQAAFPVFPFFTGIQLNNPGDYEIIATYQPSTLKTILLILGILTFIFGFKKISKL